MTVASDEVWSLFIAAAFEVPVVCKLHSGSKLLPVMYAGHMLPQAASLSCLPLNVGLNHKDK